MTAGRAVTAAVGLAGAFAAGGCVDRRFVIESNVPNAQVYIDHRPIGAAPADAPFEYYGYYTVSIVHPDYVPIESRVKVKAPWYAYPPFDFAAEVLWPFRVSDVRRFHFDLQPATQVNTGELIQNADGLRQRGLSLPPPSQPETPRRGDPPPTGLPPAPGVPSTGLPPVGVPPASMPSVQPGG